MSRRGETRREMSYSKRIKKRILESTREKARERRERDRRVFKRLRSREKGVYKRKSELWRCRSDLSFYRSLLYVTILVGMLPNGSSSLGLKYSSHDDCLPRADLPRYSCRRNTIRSRVPACTNKEMEGGNTLSYLYVISLRITNFDCTKKIVWKRERGEKALRVYPC